VARTEENALVAWAKSKIYTLGDPNPIRLAAEVRQAFYLKWDRRYWSRHAGVDDMRLPFNPRFNITVVAGQTYELSFKQLGTSTIAPAKIIGKHQETVTIARQWLRLEQYNVGDDCAWHWSGMSDQVIISHFMGLDKWVQIEIRDNDNNDGLAVSDPNYKGQLANFDNNCDCDYENNDCVYAFMGQGGYYQPGFRKLASPYTFPTTAAFQIHMHPSFKFKQPTEVAQRESLSKMLYPGEYLPDWEVFWRWPREAKADQCFWYRDQIVEDWGATRILDLADTDALQTNLSGSVNLLMTSSNSKMAYDERVNSLVAIFACSVMDFGMASAALGQWKADGTETIPRSVRTQGPPVEARKKMHRNARYWRIRTHQEKLQQDTLTPAQDWDNSKADYLVSAHSSVSMNPNYFFGALSEIKFKFGGSNTWEPMQKKWFKDTNMLTKSPKDKWVQRAVDSNLWGDGIDTTSFKCADIWDDNGDENLNKNPHAMMWSGEGNCQIDLDFKKAVVIDKVYFVQDTNWCKTVPLNEALGSYHARHSGMYWPDDCGIQWLDFQVMPEVMSLINLDTNQSADSSFHWELFEFDEVFTSQLFSMEKIESCNTKMPFIFSVKFYDDLSERWVQRAKWIKDSSGECWAKEVCLGGVKGDSKANPPTPWDDQIKTRQPSFALNTIYYGANKILSGRLASKRGIAASNIMDPDDSPLFKCQKRCAGDGAFWWLASAWNACGADTDNEVPNAQCFPTDINITTGKSPSGFSEFGFVRFASNVNKWANYIDGLMWGGYSKGPWNTIREDDGRQAIARAQKLMLGDA
jgi:hypothetical protein